MMNIFWITQVQTSVFQFLNGRDRISKLSLYHHCEEHGISEPSYEYSPNHTELEYWYHVKNFINYDCRTTSISCLPNIRITELSTLFPAIIHFKRASHWNNYSRKIKFLLDRKWFHDFTQREWRESSLQLHYNTPFSRLCTQEVDMFLLLQDMLGK